MNVGMTGTLVARLAGEAIDMPGYGLLPGVVLC